jgi:acyl-coenzyme A thioesterase PaaI-like protein
MHRDGAPPVNVPADWLRFWPFPAGTEGRSFVSGRPSHSRLRVAYFRREKDDRLLARAWFGPETEGPPDHVHGGAIAAVLDEAMGGACWMHGHRVLAGRLSVTYRKLVPFGTDATVEAWIDLVDGRKISTRARLLDERGETCADADGCL